MSVDWEGLERVAKRFIACPTVKEMELMEKEVEEILLEYAKRYSGCINCIYSGPYCSQFRWTSRTCVLRLRQGACIMRKPIITV